MGIQGLSGSIEAMKCRNEFVSSNQSDECGCPEEDWVIGNLYVTIHLEPESGGHIFIDCGDWQDEKLVDCNSIEDLRLKAEEWTNSFPVQD